MINDVIVAQATPIGKNGISIVRLSGKDCLNIAKQIFISNRFLVSTTPNYMYLGKIDLGNLKDNGFCVYFKSPHSYTGEDVVEFQCHGGYLVAEKIIKQCLNYGARLAEPGEFSKRAFLNGKMTLDEAEGVIETINAETENQLKAGNDLTNGFLFKIITKSQNLLTEIQADIEVNLDYPEHDIEYETKQNILNKINLIKISVDNLLITEEEGKIVKDGVNVAIVGKTNVGKSSLLNALINYDQAIVTDIEGTTRDVIVASIEYKGIKFNFYDTAGIRETKDKIEEIGIKKAKQILEDSDLVLYVVDISSNENQKILEDINNKNKKYLIVFNKCDINDFNNEKNANCVYISAKQKINIEILKQKIYEKTINQNISNGFVLTNLRHIEILKQAKQIIEDILLNIQEIPLDCLAVDTKTLWDKLGEITGNTSNEEIIDKIFSKFCLGK